jgi:hypothetical protein
MSRINLINKYIDDEQLDAYKNLGINRKEMEKYASLTKPVIKKIIKSNNRPDQEEGFNKNVNTKKYDSFGNLKTSKFINREGYRF